MSEESKSLPSLHQGSIDHPDASKDTSQTSSDKFIIFLTTIWIAALDLGILLLDELNEHLKRKGATVAAFQARVGLGEQTTQTEPMRVSDSMQDRQTGQLTTKDSLASLGFLAEALAARFARRHRAKGKGQRVKVLAFSFAF